MLPKPETVSPSDENSVGTFLHSDWEQTGCVGVLTIKEPRTSQTHMLFLHFNYPAMPKRKTMFYNNTLFTRRMKREMDLQAVEEIPFDLNTHKNLNVKVTLRPKIKMYGLKELEAATHCCIHLQIGTGAAMLLLI